MLEGDVLDEARALGVTAVEDSPRRSSTYRVVGTPTAKDAASVDDLLKVSGSSNGGGAASGLPDAETLRRDAQTLNSRLRAMNLMLLNPRSKFMQYWDLVTLIALLFTATITPYEVCMLWDEPKFADGSWASPLFFINWLVNLVFIADIIFNFFLPYRESIRKGGGTVKSHSRIARRYLCSFFIIDFISVLPVDNIMMAVDTSNMEGAGALSAIKMLRLLRLLKLARILRASRIFARWENSISISYAKQDLYRWTILVMILLHWLACLLGITAQLSVPPRSNDLRLAVQAAAATDPQCHGCTPTLANDPDSVCKSPCLTTCERWELARLQLPGGYDDEISARAELLWSQQSWICRYAEMGKVRPPTWHGEVWVAGLYVAMIQMGGGVGSIVPENLSEYLVFLFGILLGSVTWAMVVGTICATMATGDPHTNAFKQNMDSLNYFLEDMNMPQELCVRAREYVRNGRDLIKKRSYTEIIDGLSPELRADIVLHMSANTLEQIWYLSSLEQAARVELAVRLARSGYAPREKLVTRDLCILVRGVAAKAGNILTPPNHWGEDVIVSSHALRDLRPASALTYVEVATLSRAAFDEVLTQFPESAAIVRRAAMRLAMQRAVVIISEYLRSRNDLRGGRSERKLKRGYTNLATAFGGGGSSTSSDPATILRMITGQHLRDIVDGYLVEEVDEEAQEAHGADASAGEVVKMRRELASVRGDLSELKGMVKLLLAAPGSASVKSPGAEGSPRAAQ
jgi:hypothetical protein